MGYRGVCFLPPLRSSSTLVALHLIVLKSSFEKALSNEIDHVSALPAPRKNPTLSAVGALDGVEIVRHSVRKTRESITLSQDDIDLLVSIHNEARRKEGSADMIELRWDDNLASNAQEWADKCLFSYARNYVPSVVDQNLFMVSYSENIKPNYTMGAIMWYREKFNYNENYCSLICSNYLTMVRWNVIQMGCGAKVCKDLEGIKGESVNFICEYFSRYTNTSIFPYLRGKPCSKCPRDFPICHDGLCAGEDSKYRPWSMDIVLAIQKPPKKPWRNHSSDLRSSLILMMLMMMLTY